MTTQSHRVSVWRLPEDAPSACTCRRPNQYPDVQHVICGGSADHRNGCPGMTGWIRPDGLWCEDLPPPPPSSPVLDPGLYDAHAARAVDLYKAGRARSVAAACRQAVSEMGRGTHWGANAPRIGVPDRLYRRARSLLKRD